MNPSSPKIPVRTWLIAVAAFLLFAGALVARWREGGSLAAVRTEVPALRATLAALPVPDGAELNRWRGRHAELAAQRWTEPARTALASRLGSRWRWLPIAGEAGTRSFVLHAVAPEALPWSAVLSTLAGLELSPGAAVEGVTIVTAGTRAARQFSVVKIHVRFQWAEAGAGHTFPPESIRRDRVLPEPVSPGRAAGRRARPTPLRRTSAFAQPPAPARPPLRSRPDHPPRPRSRQNLSEP
jgi:hypothetical protein